METTRKVIAAIVGIIVVIILILLARFVGDQVRQRFFQSTPVVVEETRPVIQAKPSKDLIEVKIDTNTTATATGTGKGKGTPSTTIPATGPKEDAMVIMGLMFLAGVSMVALSKKFVYTV